MIGNQLIKYSKWVQQTNVSQRVLELRCRVCHAKLSDYMSYRFSNVCLFIYLFIYYFQEILAEEISVVEVEEVGLFLIATYFLLLTNTRTKRGADILCHMFPDFVQSPAKSKCPLGYLLLALGAKLFLVVPLTSA